METHYCNPKKNETLERYKFFTRVQGEGERLDKFIVDLKIWVATCNFGTLRDLLVRDRIKCEICDTKLQEDLKLPNLDPDKCLNACRVLELSKERNKAIEATADTVHNLKKAKMAKLIRTQTGNGSANANSVRDNMSVEIAS